MELPVINEDNFRLSADKVHLTYKGHLDFGFLKNVVVALGGNLAMYSIVHERGDGGETPYDHTHFYAKWFRKVDTRNPRIFDCVWEGETVHPHIRRISTKLHESRIYHEYHRKDPVALEQSEAAPSPPPGKTEETVRKCKGDIYEAMRAFGVTPRTVSDLSILCRFKQPREPHVHRYPGTEWTLRHPTEFKVLYVYGPTNLGKTQWALAALKRPLLVCQWEDLRDYDELVYDGIVFDDMSFSHLPPSTCIHLLDWDLDRVLHARYTNITIPKETRKVFVSNKRPEDCFPSSDADLWPAIRRRISHVMHVTALTY